MKPVAAVVVGANPDSYKSKRRQIQNGDTPNCDIKTVHVDVLDLSAFWLQVSKTATQ